MTCKTKNPTLFTQFIEEVGMDVVKKELESFESFHGEIGDTIEIVFFRHIPGKCGKEIKEDDITNYKKLLHRNFSDYALSKEDYIRQLLITVEI